MPSALSISSIIGADEVCPRCCRNSWRLVSMRSFLWLSGHHIYIIQQRVPERFPDRNAFKRTSDNKVEGIFFNGLDHTLVNYEWSVYSDKDSGRQLIFNSFHCKMNGKSVIVCVQGNIIFKSFNKYYLSEFQFYKRWSFFYEYFLIAAGCDFFACKVSYCFIDSFTEPTISNRFKKIINNVEVKKLLEQILPQRILLLY